MASNEDNKNNQWKPFERIVPAPRNVMLEDPELANPPPSQPEAMQSGWVPKTIEQE